MDCYYNLLDLFLEVESPQKEIDFIEGGDIQKAEMTDSLKYKDSLNN